MGDDKMLKIRDDQLIRESQILAVDFQPKASHTHLTQTPQITVYLPHDQVSLVGEEAQRLWDYLSNQAMTI
jgi:hypothetical protein